MLPSPFRLFQPLDPHTAGPAAGWGGKTRRVEKKKTNPSIDWTLLGATAARSPPGWDPAGAEGGGGEPQAQK